MPRIQGRLDPNQPSPRALHFIKNKTNINDMKLRRTLEGFDREKIQIITNIDHDRLDVKDFLKDVKHCASDVLPEARLWLGEKSEQRRMREQEEATRSIFTAPAGNKRTARDGRDVKTAPEQQSTRPSEQDDVVQVGIFFKKRRDVDPNRVHIDIYSRRNMYSSIGRERTMTANEEAEAFKKEEEEKQVQKWLEDEERQKHEAEERRAQEEAEERRQAEERRRSEAVDILNLDRPRTHTSASIDSETRRRGEIRAEMRRISGVRGKTDLEKRESRIRAINDNAELMKDILIKNAKKRAMQKKKKSPIEDRIRTFFTRIEDMRKIEDEEQNIPTSTEQKRRYVLMTKGVKAALEIQDDASDTENPHHTF